MDALTRIVLCRDVRSMVTLIGTELFILVRVNIFEHNILLNEIKKYEWGLKISRTKFSNTMHLKSSYVVPCSSWDS